MSNDDTSELAIAMFGEETISGAYETIPLDPSRTYQSLTHLADDLNENIFAGRLPRFLIRYQSGKSSFGHFSAGRFENYRDASEVAHEIVLNPAFFHRSERLIAATLTHEMVHLDQELNGKPGRGGYHNKEWAEMMDAIGLIPSDTGEPGGKRTGDRVSHYIQEGGLFDLACTRYLRHNALILFQDRAFLPIFSREGEDHPGHEGAGEEEEDDRLAAARARAKKAASKTKYVCGMIRCKQVAWAKPGARFLCQDHEEGMVPERKSFAEETD